MVSPRAADVRLDPEATEFVRFCYRRRSVGWPELYDEMCAVANRRLFRGWDQSALGEHGVGFGLFELPALAALTAAVVAEELAVRPAGRPTRTSRRRDPLDAASAPTEGPEGSGNLHPSAATDARSADDADGSSGMTAAATIAAATPAAATAERAPESTDPMEALALAS
jgi:hypothetical protein